LDEEAGSGDAALDGGDTNAHYLVGRGFACGIQPYGRSRFFADRASCWMGLERDGSAVVRIGVTDLGAGQAASLAQITAEVLGVHPDRISVHIADTALTPLSGGTFGTRQLYMSGNAVLKTARELRDKLAPVATSLLGVDDPAELEFADDRVAVRGGARPVPVLGRALGRGRGARRDAVSPLNVRGRDRTLRRADRPRPDLP